MSTGDNRCVGVGVSRNSHSQVYVDEGTSVQEPIGALVWECV